MSPRFASAITIRPRSRARAATCAQRAPPRRAETLEAGDLDLDGDALFGDGLDRQRAVERDSQPRPRSGRDGRAVGRARQLDRAWPQLGRIGIQPEHQLRAAVGHAAGQPIAESASARGA